MVSYLTVWTKTQFPIFNFHLKFPCYPLQPKDYQQVFIVQGSGVSNTPNT